MTAEPPDRITSIRPHLVTALTVLAVLVALFYNGQDVVLYSVAATLLLSALVLAVYPAGTADHFTIGPAGLVLLGLFTWSAMSAGWSVIPYLTLLELGVTGAAVVAYLAWRPILPTPRARGLAAAVFIVLGLVLSVVMLAQVTAGNEPAASFLNPNSAAGFVNLLWPIPATLALFTAFRKKLTAGLLVAVAVMMFAASINGSRAAVLACLIMTVILTGAGVIALRGWRRPLLFAAVAFGALLAAQVANLLGFGGRGGGLLGRVATLADPTAAGGTRLPIWQAAWEMIGERPWLGYGPGTFYQVYPAFRLPEDRSSGVFVHNDYLQFWVERGLPGFLLLLLLLIVCIWLFVRQTSGPGSRGRIAGVLAAGTALAGAAVHALFSYNLHVLPFVIVFGVALAALDSSPRTPPRWPISLTRIRSSRVGALAVVGMGVLVVLHLSLVAATYRYTRSAYAHLAVDELAPAREDFMLAQRLWSAPDLHWSGHADVYRRTLEILPEEMTQLRAAAKKTGMELAREALHRNRYRAETLAILGELHRQSPRSDPAAAEHAFEQALARNPRALRARLSLADLLHEQAGAAAALAAVEQGLNAYHKNPPILLLQRAMHLHDRVGNTARTEALREQIRQQLSRYSRTE